MIENMGGRTVWVCVDRFDRGAMGGRLYDDYRKAERCYESLGNMLMEMSELLRGEQEQPSLPSVRERTAIPACKGAPRPLYFREGEHATFVLRILFQHNESWQGTMTWLEDNTTQSFRSALEMIVLMRSVLQKKDKPEKAAADALDA